MLNLYGRNAEDSGKYGDIFELNIKAFLGLQEKMGKVGRTDVRKSNVTIECKTNGGELNDGIGNKLVKGSAMVVYAPFVDIAKDIDEQDAYFITREQFLSVLSACGLIREKTTSDGRRINTIQTVWVYKHNKAHSLKKYNMLCAMLEECENENGITFSEWLNSYK